MERVAVVSVHPDDEMLGCGGSLLRHKALGHHLFWIILTDVSTEWGFSPEFVARRDDEIALITRELGFKAVLRLGYPTARLEPRHAIEMIPRIMDFLKAHQPTTLYVVNRSDAHSDHRLAFDATMACTKSFRAPFLKRVLMYECLSETEFAPALQHAAFVPNYWVNISEYLERKIELCHTYTSEMGEHPFPRSTAALQALAHLRGSTAGFRAAEAFQVLKWVED